jgi:hypothetical protein
MLRGVAIICLTALVARAEDLPLPTGEGFFLEPAPSMLPASGAAFLRPTKSIKPPPALPGGRLAAAQPQVHAPTEARLRRLILLPGGLSPQAMREQIVAGGQGLQPMTVVGMQAPAPVLANLASFFGGAVNPETQKRLVDTVRHGLADGRSAPSVSKWSAGCPGRASWPWRCIPRAERLPRSVAS